MAKILIVEDEEMNREMLDRRLARRGYETIVAGTGPEGIDAAQAELPDLILMDIGLPGMDGLEATRILKSDPATAHIPIIVLTAHAFEEDREKSLAVGSDDFDTKPIEISRLVSKIEAALGG